MGRMRQKATVSSPSAAAASVAARDASGMSIVRGAARMMPRRMVGKGPLSMRCTGGKHQTDQAIMTGADSMRGSASWLAASPKPPASNGADAYKGTSSSVIVYERAACITKKLRSKLHRRRRSQFSPLLLASKQCNVSEANFVIYEASSYFSNHDAEESCDSRISVECESKPRSDSKKSVIINETEDISKDKCSELCSIWRSEKKMTVKLKCLNLRVWNRTLELVNREV